mmetsp:Transcript_30599/g.74698  ORF Transcript_30599/g.74698 Transcript_30599/m.74698 type:complete len:210 (-) Transcript_30599:219-848(-)
MWSGTDDASRPSEFEHALSSSRAAHTRYSCVVMSSTSYHTSRAACEKPNGICGRCGTTSRLCTTRYMCGASRPSANTASGLLPTRGWPNVYTSRCRVPFATAVTLVRMSSAANTASAPPSEWPVTRTPYVGGAARSAAATSLVTFVLSVWYALQKPRCARHAVSLAAASSHGQYSSLTNDKSAIQFGIESRCVPANATTTWRCTWSMPT